MGDPSTSDLVLRDVTVEDLSVFFEQQREPEAVRMAALPARDRDSFTAHWSKVLADATVVTQTIVVDGRVAGNVVSFERSGRRLVGYWIGREFWGRGVATRALATFLRHVPERPLYAHVATHNAGSIRVLEKCGFTLSADRDDRSEPPEDGVEEVMLELPRSSPTARSAHGAGPAEPATTS